MQTYLPLLPYLIPPLLGAVIGYVTNRIAIRMLFRPLRPWRVAGVRMPLTPGIIPAKRGELAARMGEMVGSHLLTGDDVRQALEQPRFRKELRGVVDEKLAGFIDRDLGSLESLVPKDFRQRFRDLVDLLRWKLVGMLGDYLHSQGFEDSLRGYLQSTGDRLLARDLESFLTPENYRDLRQHLDERLSTLLASPEVKEAVARFLDERVDRFLQSERCLREILPEDLIEVVFDQLEREIPPLLERFGSLLHDPVFRARLVERIQKGIAAFLDSLSGLTGLLSGFINLEQVHQKIPGFLDQAADEIAQWLREERTQQQVAGMLRERLEALLDRPLSNFVEKVPYEKVTGMRRFLRRRVVAAVTSRRATEMALGVLDASIQNIKDRSFRSLLERALPEEGIERLQRTAADRLLELLRSPATEKAIDRVVGAQLEERVYRRKLGRLSARLPADIREELAEGICRQLGDVLGREVPSLLETLNVSRMVEEKVNRLDILKVEGLLLGVMQEQFKYINLFGALLGGLIGLLNALLLVLL
ncbi:MAG TPA: DUF445 family protein [Desulfuromonadales bacterium]|nr:DUF445 family protein [Desulfuromonadales bacterium]